MPDKKQFIGRWVHWEDTVRLEQELLANGRFKGVAFDEEQGEIIGWAGGTWQIVGDAIHWRYTSAENLAVPTKVEVNPVVHLDENRFDLRETSRRRTDWYRAVKSEETSANFDAVQVQPFLERIVGFIDSGFGRTEVAALVKKMRRLKPDQTHQVVFSITCRKKVSPLRVRVFMDDVDAPDLYLYGPVNLTRRIEAELKKMDTGTGG